MKVVLDTAALISAIRSSTRAAAEIVRLAAVGKLTLLMDYKLVCEYRDVALRPPHIAASGRTSEDAEATIEMLEAIATPVLVRIKHRPLSKDGNDDMVLDVAINGQADAVVTNNIKDFRAAGERFGIQVLTPRDFLIAFRKGNLIMPANQRKSIISKFPLRLMPSVRRVAEDFSLKEGVSLNQFINVAVAEKLVHLQHDEWLATRPKPTAARISRALAILDQPTQNAPDPGDELPDGHVSIRETDEYKQALGAK